MPATKKVGRIIYLILILKEKWQDISVTQQTVTIAKMNILNQTKDARSAIVRHTRTSME